jgi:hypothetical protein
VDVLAAGFHTPAVNRGAGFGRRLAAGILDWTLCGVAGLALLYLGLAGIVLAPVLVVAYFTASWARWSRTLGLAAVDLMLARRPGVGRAIGRGVLAAVSGAAGFVVFTFFVFSDEPTGGYSTAETALGDSALGVAAAAALGHLWALVDTRGQSVQDKLFGLLTVPAHAGAGARRDGAPSTPPAPGPRG